MLIPLSWLKEYVDIKMPFKELAEKLSAAGLTVEVWHEQDGDIIFDPEITPNRPDWMSVTGIAREVAAVTGAKLSLPKIIPVPTNVKNPLQLTYKDDPKLCPRTSRILIRGVKVKPSPEWLAKRTKQIGLRPINNLVDITNYVLWMYGNPLHVFDYDKIRGHTMTVELSRGGEDFRSLDGINYKLPKNAIVIKDVGRVIDLLPLKGGENTSVGNETKNILLHSIVCDPVLTRKTSQSLGLRSDSSAVSERGVDQNGTTKAALKALELILEIAGGEIASSLIEVPEKPYSPWPVDLRHSKLEKVLGIKFEPQKVAAILERLELSTTTKQQGNETVYSVTVPTFRNDLHIEEDLIEEVGRIHGYDNFPKTLPAGAIPTAKVAYARYYDLEYEVKQILKGAGYSEIYTYSLISEKQLLNLGIDSSKVLRVDNPISRDYEYLRPRTIGNLLEAIKLNQPNFSEVKLYELGKHYTGATIDKFQEEYWLSGAQTGEKFFEVKGLVERLLTQFGIDYQISPDDKGVQGHPGRSAIISADNKLLGYLGEIHPSLLAKFAVKGHLSGFTLNYDLFESLITKTKVYQPISKYPAVVEDLSLQIPGKILYGQAVSEIKRSSHLVKSVDLIDEHEGSKTVRVSYQSSSQNLTDQDVSKARKVILANLKEKLQVREKE